MKPFNIALKGILLFILFNLLFATLQPGIGKLSAYNILFPGRERLPFGENSAQSYNLSLFDLDAMFAAHVIHGTPKQADEFRVILIGDSSVWGTLLKPEETLAGQINSQGLSTCGKTVRAYNLGYPTISLTKDLLLLERAVTYQPDLILWLTTLEAFPRDKQFSSPLVANNKDAVLHMAAASGLQVDANSPEFSKDSFWQDTIIGQRRALADIFRLQLHGVMWAATGVDQVYPDSYEKAQTDLEADESFHGFEPATLDKDALAFDVLSAGMKLAGDIPVTIIMEPMLISSGANSDIRYNFFYPRWAYDQYREWMNEMSFENGSTYSDLWDVVPSTEFTNSAIHLTPRGEALLASAVKPLILSACK